MHRKLSVWLRLCLSSFALAQNTIPQKRSASQSSSSTVQVVYVVDGGNKPQRLKPNPFLATLRHD